MTDSPKEKYRKRRYEKAQQEIGNKYNKLTIESINYEKTEENNRDGKHYGVFFNCICDCGNHVVCRLNALKTNHIKSCGCLRFNNPLNMNDLTGKKFGRLTVVKRDIERDLKLREEGKKNTHWLCQCDCGNPDLISIDASCLVNGHTKSCGCYASEQIAKRNKKYSTKENCIKNDDLNNTIVLYDDNMNECIIDKDDYDIVKQWYWRKIDKRGSIKKGYWVTNSKKGDGYNKSILMIHQVIAEIKYGEYDHKLLMPDHLSRDTDDNRKFNIILKNNQENCKNRSRSKKNTSGKTGVHFNKDSNKWTAYITVNYKTIYLGAFTNKEDAINARIKAENKYGYTCDDNVAEYDIVG